MYYRVVRQGWTIREPLETSGNWRFPAGFRNFLSIKKILKKLKNSENCRKPPRSVSGGFQQVSG